MNVLKFIPPTPAITGENVRMIGMNWASTIVFRPCFSKNAAARIACFLLKKMLFSRLKMRGPDFLPMKYPSELPRIAAAVRTD